MNTVRPIRSEADYEAALARIDELMDSRPDTAEHDELDLLATLVEVYEEERFPVDLPSPIEAIEFRMEQANLSQAQLAKYIGSRAKVSEVMSGKRPLTLKMVRALNQHLGIPAEVLISNGTAQVNEPDDLQWSKFPVFEMVKRGWLRNTPSPKANAKELMLELIQKAGGHEAVPQAFYRKNNSARRNARMDSYALQAWCLYVLAKARENPPTRAYREDAISEAFLRFLATLSRLSDGPRRAVEALSEQGVAVVYARHLPRTHLDGAAMRTKEGVPVIGLTLRHDRLDNFWFCLMHEMAHIWRHVTEGNGFYVDDLSLSESDHDEDWSIEEEADQIAQDALIPSDAWAKAQLVGRATPSRVISFAQSVNVHPAIVAGRVRRETGNYRLLSQFVGMNEVSKHFEDEHK